MILSREFKTVWFVLRCRLCCLLCFGKMMDVVLLDMNFGTGSRAGERAFSGWTVFVNVRDPPEVVLITAFW